MKRPTTAVVLLLAVSSVACDSPARSLDVVAIDSAGVEIIEYGILDDLPSDTLQREVMRIGDDPSERPWEFIADAALLPDGRIVVLDGGATQQLVFLGPGGEVRRVVGGAGEGPGEFGDASQVILSEDGTRLGVHDWRTQRLTVFDAEGDLIDTHSMVALDYAGVLALTPTGPVTGPPKIIMNGGRRYAEPWKRVGLTTGSFSDPGSDTVAKVDWDQSLDFGGDDVFAAKGFSAFAGGWFAVARGDRAQVEWFREGDGLTRVTRWTAEAAELSDSLFNEYAEAWRAFAAGRIPSEMIEERLEILRTSVVGVLPMYSDILPSRDGEFWLGEYAGRTYHRPPAEGRRFVVLGRDGSVRKTAWVAPAMVRVLDVRGERVLGVALDEFDVQHLVVYERGTGRAPT